ncbi:MAG: class I SAM-dependent methyltransferase [Actinomycetota bacterium]|nr:class I SAM-dependent methyltransferase [Actinomycetota bacterium]
MGPASLGVARRELERRTSSVVDRIGPGPGSVVDAGAGPGRLLGELCTLGWNVVGVDVALAMVELAQQRLVGSHGGVVQGRIGELPIRSAGCDVAVATGVLEYVGAVVGAGDELGRGVRPGGLVVVTTPNRSSLPLLCGRYGWYPAIQCIKRRLPFGAPAPLRRPGPVSVRQLRTTLRGSHLAVRDVDYVAVRLLPAPFHQLFPSLAVRLADRLESRLGLVTRFFATQVVVTSVKQ